MLLRVKPLANVEGRPSATKWLAATRRSEGLRHRMRQRNYGTTALPGPADRMLYLANGHVQVRLQAATDQVTP
jgi:hypothetical protein